MPVPDTDKKPFHTPRRSRSLALLCCLLAMYYASIAAPIAGVISSWLTAIGGLFGNFFGLIISDLGDAISTLFLLILLLLGFGFMGRWINKQRRPLVCMGLQFRPGWTREWAMGAALGWGIIVAAVLPLAIAGSLHFAFAFTPGSFWLLAVNVVVLLLVALTEEIIYRGYAFQRLIEAFGPTAATLLMAVYIGILHWHNPGQSLAGTLVTVLGAVLMALAYLRTRALWLVWGLHFAWSVSEGVLFGLPVAGFSSFATVVQTDTTGPLWLTGGDYGPEGTVIMLLVLIAAIGVLVFVTRDLNWKYNAPVLIPGGIPMDVPPPAEHVAMEKAAAAPALVQIQPIGGAPAPGNADAAMPAPPVEEK